MKSSSQAVLLFQFLSCFVQSYNLCPQRDVFAADSYTRFYLHFISHSHFSFNQRATKNPTAQFFYLSTGSVHVEASCNKHFRLAVQIPFYCRYVFLYCFQKLVYVQLQLRRHRNYGSILDMSPFKKFFYLVVVLHCFFFGNKIHLALHDNHILYSCSLQSYQMFHSLQLRASFIRSNDEKSSIHQTSASQNSRHQRFVSWRVDYAYSPLRSSIRKAVSALGRHSILAAACTPVYRDVSIS